MLLLALTCLRMALVVLHQPMAGYANNLDFFRQSACVGVWENYPDRPKIAANLDAPVGDLIYDGQRVDDWCVWSSDDVFAWVVTRLHRTQDHVPMQQIGAAKMVAAWAVMMLVVAMPVGAVSRLVCALAMVVVFGDIAVLTYFNTLYVDASGLIFCTALVALIGVVGALRRAPGWWFLGGFSACLVWFGAVKPQYAPLAMFLGIAGAAYVFGFWRDWLRASGLLAMAALAGSVFLVMNPAGRSVVAAMNHANAADTILGAVLPQAADRMAALATLGLPPGCADAIAVDGNGLPVQPETLCPAVNSVARLRLLILFAQQPGTLLGPLSTAIRGSRPSYLWFPHFTQPSDAGSVLFKVLYTTSLSTWLAALPGPAYRCLIWFMCGLGVCSAPVWVICVLRGSGGLQRYPETGFLVLGGLVCIYALFSSVFGDGFSELPRHTAVLLVGVAFFLSGVLGLASRAVIRP